MKNRGGFTIVETLIVLAVSSAMFVSVMIFFNGRQGRVEFSQGMRDIESHIRDVSNDVRNGYYPNPNQQCSVISGAITFNSSASTQQGTSNACVFAGKVMLFDGTNDLGQINSYSVAGIKNVNTLVNLKPKIMGSLGTETLEDYTMPSGIKLINQDKQPIKAALALFFDLSSNATSGSVNVLPYKINLISNDLQSAVSNMFNSINPTGGVISDTGVKLCFASGTNNQSGIISVIKSTDGLSTSVLIGQDIVASTGCWDGVTL